MRGSIFGAMRVSANAIELIVHFEGLVPHAYNDPAPGGGHCTFGVGHLIHHGPCTEADYRKFGRKGAQRPHAVDRAKRILREDLEHFEVRVTQLVRKSTRQREFDAMVSLAFNIGLGAFESSSVRRLHNLRLGFLAGRAFGLWVKASGATLPGLVRRRKAERWLYRKGKVRTFA